MTNSIRETFNSDSDLYHFVNSRFKKNIGKASFPSSYVKRRTPQSFLDSASSDTAKEIAEKELIRDNIYLKYKFDIFEYPIVVFYENKSKEVLKPFKLPKDANNFSKDLLRLGQIHY